MHEEVIMAGSGGQGLMIMGQLLAFAAVEEGYHVVWFPSYGPEARGGTADSTVIMSSEEIGSPISVHPDSLVAMHPALYSKMRGSVKKGGRIFINSSLIDTSDARDDCMIYPIPANTMAEEIGNIRSANMIMLGAYTEATRVVKMDLLFDLLAEVLPPHRHKFIDVNKRALQAGADLIAGV